MTSYLCLLRGINVGGKNIIKMTDLKSCFQTMGFQSVQTYIQSGNVLFKSEIENQEQLTTQIEQKLEQTFQYQAKVVLVNQQFLTQVVANKPENFGSEPNELKYDVFFIKPPLTAEIVFPEIPTKTGVDFIWCQNHVIYYSRKSAHSGQSHITKIIGTSLYKQMTIRNWNTTQKLAQLITNL